MEKNRKILYCLLGSFVLALLNSQLFEFAASGIFPSGYGSSVFGVPVMFVIDVLSFIGLVLLAIFSIILIINNIRSND